MIPCLISVVIGFIIGAVVLFVILMNAKPPGMF